MKVSRVLLSGSGIFHSAGARRLTENSARSEDDRKLRIKIRFCEANSELFNE